MESENDLVIRALDLQNKGMSQEAAKIFHEILAANPIHVVALYSLSVIAVQAGDTATALALIDRSLRACPTFAHSHFARGTILLKMKRGEEALASFDQALLLQPDYPEALVNRGALLQEIGRHYDALANYERLLELHPNHTVALGNRGIILTELKRDDEAAVSFAEMLRIDPNYEYGLGLLAYARLHVCDWTDADALRDQIIEGVRAGKRVCKSLAFMSLSDSAKEHLQCARIFAENKYPPTQPTLWKGERYTHDRIRVAYVSPDLREHPVAHLMTGIFEHHDQSRFEIIGISLGIDDNSRLRSRIMNSCDRFIDVRAKTSLEIAELIRSLEVDIAVDLAGYTADSRTDVFSWRPAPIQMNYLGYPGSLGAPYFDYIIADRHTIPETEFLNYEEKVIHLPKTYLPADDSIKISENLQSRAEFGLPPDAFVFCSFNHDYKITPQIFSIWMGLLQQVPGSVLWLMKLKEAAQVNLRREAAKYGIEPSRLIFATRVPRVEDHLARYRLADIFLDTTPYNAHTTASDALRTGLPVITCACGNSFPSRVAASLLHATDMPELVTTSLEEYAALALRLATNPDQLAAVKEKLATNIKRYVLNTALFCRHLESAYHAAWLRHQEGKDPAPFAVQPENEPVYEPPSLYVWRMDRFYEPLLKCFPDAHQQSCLVMGETAWFRDHEFTDWAVAACEPEEEEKLILADNSVDYVYCDHAISQFRRPLVALYEMIRTARKAVIIVARQDPYIDQPTVAGNHVAYYEKNGRYVFMISRREMEKVALSLSLPAFAFKGIFDLGEPDPALPMNQADCNEYKRKTLALEKMCERNEQKFNYLMAVLFKSMPPVEDLRGFDAQWAFTINPRVVPAGVR